LRIAPGSAQKKALLKPDVLDHRLNLFSEIIALLTAEIQASSAKLR